MNRTENFNWHSAGGKATAIKEKQEAKKRIDDYNQNPNFCKQCNAPILAPYDKKLRETKLKQFCSQSCAAKYSNKKRALSETFTSGPCSYIDKFSDKEVIEYFNKSSSFKEFVKKLGYQGKISTTNSKISTRLNKLGLDIRELLQKEGRNCKLKSQTKEELFSKRNSWQTARSSIQKDARITYQASSKPKQCIICGYDKHYEVAHIKAVSDFDGTALISEINNIDNLIALCPNHHWEYDNGLLTL